MNKEEKTNSLERLEKEVLEDSSLPLLGANLVFGEGSANAKIFFAGEAPGFHEDRMGRPFVGQAGKLLDKLIDEAGWKRTDVYITNIVKRRPPENRDPMPDEVAAYAPYLYRQIEIISPKIIVPLGRFAANYFVPALKISKDQGKAFWWKEYLVIPMYHPAAGLRSGTMLEDLKKSFKKLPEALEKYDTFLKEKIPANGETEKDEKQATLF